MQNSSVDPFFSARALIALPRCLRARLSFPLSRHQFSRGVFSFRSAVRARCRPLASARVRFEYRAPARLHADKLISTVEKKKASGFPRTPAHFRHSALLSGCPFRKSASAIRNPLRNSTFRVPLSLLLTRCRVNTRHIPLSATEKAARRRCSVRHDRIAIRTVGRDRLRVSERRRIGGNVIISETRSGEWGISILRSTLRCISVCDILTRVDIQRPIVKDCETRIRCAGYNGRERQFCRVRRSRAR